MRKGEKDELRYNAEVREGGLTGEGCEEWVAEGVVGNGTGAEVGRRSLVGNKGVTSALTILVGCGSKWLSRLVPYCHWRSSNPVGPAKGNSSLFADSLDIDPKIGIVYFGVTNVDFQIKDLNTILSSGDSTGSLLKYDPSTNQTAVLLSDLAIPAGVAVSRDGSFVLVSEYTTSRIRRFWLKGSRANSSEIFIRFAGRPDITEVTLHNIKRNSRGQFWEAVNGFLGPPPLPIRPALPEGVIINENDLVLQVVSLAQEYGTTPVSEVQEFNGTL
ncbi:protein STRICTOSIDINE SYNTHASE-LIKE 12-like [Lotus japonicus]|uniref:protein STRICTOSIDINE SYNTHASE-LIKE 12-like n=1 Tax=Lotus japonicus TaxID=34305 RepID=UPI00258CAD68|nr:protein STRICTOSIDINE SYNTHASE-LIKE 12-like [Lotus japonicus]